jgi:hypothetical protein
LKQLLAMRFIFREEGNCIVEVVHRRFWPDEANAFTRGE